MDLWGRLSNPPEIVETAATQGFEASHDDADNTESSSNTAPRSTRREPSEEKGRLSNPPQRRLSPTDISDIIAAYTDGATISQLAADLGVHRTTVAAHLERSGVPRHSDRVAWDETTLREAAEMYATGLSLADVADRYEIDPHTVANRFRRAGVAVRPRGGWTSPAHSEQERR